MPRLSKHVSAPGPAARASNLLRHLQHGIDMAGHLHLAPDTSHRAGAVDQEGRALDAHIFPAIHALLDPGAVSLADLALLVRGEGEGQVVLGLELVVLRDAVARYADPQGVDIR